MVRFHAEAADWAGAVPEVLVNNAGIQTWASLLDLRAEQWDAVMRVNLRGTFLNTQAFARALVAAGRGGAVVNLGSGCNKVAFRGWWTTRLEGRDRAVHQGLGGGTGAYGIRVNCIAPGAIATERTAAEAGDYAGTWARVTPLRRVGTPQDIAGPMLFLISDAASYVTGQTLWVDGGTFAQANWPYEVTP